VGDRVSLIPF